MCRPRGPLIVATSTLYTTAIESPSLHRVLLRVGSWCGKLDHGATTPASLTLLRIYLLNRLRTYVLNMLSPAESFNLGRYALCVIALPGLKCLRGTTTRQLFNTTLVDTAMRRASRVTQWMVRGKPRSKPVWTISSVSAVLDHHMCTARRVSPNSGGYPFRGMCSPSGLSDEGPFNAK